MAELDWSDPEAVVRAAASTNGVELAAGWIPAPEHRCYGVKWNGELIAASPYPYYSWDQAIKDVRVQAFIAANRPEEAKDGE